MMREGGDVFKVTQNINVRFKDKCIPLSSSKNVFSVSHDFS